MTVTVTMTVTMAYVDQGYTGEQPVADSAIHSIQRGHQEP